MEWTSLAGKGLEFIYFGIIVGTIIVILLDNRNPVKTIAWILVLIFLPVIGLVVYFFFGQPIRRERLISKKGYSQLIKKPLAEFETQKPFNLDGRHQRLVNFFRHTNQSLPFDGNQIDIFTDGYSKIHALIRELYKAQKHIHMEYYIFENDAVGRLIRDVLITKARQGVEIRLIYDDVGCWHVKNSFFDKMRREGIDVRAFLKVRFPTLTSKVNYRNHHKIVIIDGQVGFIGSMNLAVRYLRGVDFGIWRDTHLMVKGKAVHGLQTAFLLDWYVTDHIPISSKSYFPHVGTYGNAIAQTVTSAPIGQWKEIMQGLTMAISSAKRYFYIQTPYFLPTETVLSAMQTAALAGIDVRLMIPEHTDNRFTRWGTRSYIKDMLLAGVKVYFYKKGFLHSKLMVADDSLSTIGSTNVDFRSFEHNFEVNLFIYDAEIALKMRDIFLSDQVDCQQIGLRKWKRRSLFHKFTESLMRLLAPLL